MSSIETLRGILVASAVVAIIVALIGGLWLPAGVLAVAVLVHGVLTPMVRRRSRADGIAPAQEAR